MPFPAASDRPLDRRIDRQEKVSPGKLHVTQYLVVAVLALLAAGMWRLQIVGVESYRQLAEANRVRKIPVLAPRGRIFDRDGRMIVDNYPSVSCYLLREQVKDLGSDLPLIARALGGIASGGVLRRPHVVFPDEVPKELAENIVTRFPGSGDRVVPITPENWETITDAMAATTVTGTAAAAHMEGIDFAGKTGTAQVVNHSAGATSLGSGTARANAWFVGMAPRRNPDIVVAVLWEHGGWGAGSSPLAAQVIDAYVTKQRKQENNLRLAETPTPDTTTPPAKTAGTTKQTTQSTPPPSLTRPSGEPTAYAAPLPRPGSTETSVRP
ncbi:MAG: hypothetical protein NVSMB62_26050 [Acidobacteriaceae bacterium]